MQDLMVPVGFIGAGNMADAMIGAMIHSQLVAPSALRASDVSPARRSEISDRYGIEVLDDNRGLFRMCRTVILSVKPQQMPGVLDGIAAAVDFDSTGERKLVISIAAGVRLHTLEDRFYAGLPDAARRRLPVIRVMPNTPALVRAGISGMSPNRFALASDIAGARQILETMGAVVEFPESLLDAVTAVSGSGPAYVFYLIEAMVEGGVQAGLDKTAAEELALQTVKGAALLMEQRRDPPEVLRREVTSPGGTTEAALRVLADRGVKAALVEAVCAAARRSVALSGPRSDSPPSDSEADR